jgi:nucleotide-binding universal stress UspA family protein
MDKRPIIVGVDASAEAASAAQFGARLAAAAGVPCHLVHASRDAWFSASVPAELAERATEFDQAVRAGARFRVAQALKDHVPADLVQAMEVDTGSPAEVLDQATLRHHPQLVVVGGKHHSVLGRWLSGSTSLNLARIATTPVLVTAGTPDEVKRILVAVDTSAAAGPTVALAREYAALLHAELRVLSVLEPLPELDEYALPPVDSVRYYELCCEMLRKDLAPHLPPQSGPMIRHGMPVETILREVALWPADLLVVGSRGKNWAQRLLLGSVTEKLLNHLPTSILVAPVRATMPAAEPIHVLAAIA